MNVEPKKKSFAETMNARFTVCVMILWAVHPALYAQTLQGTIATAIDRLIIILNLLLVAAIAWAGFLLAKGESSGVSRLVYCIVALIVVNSAQIILDFFRV